MDVRQFLATQHSALDDRQHALTRVHDVMAAEAQPEACIEFVLERFGDALDAQGLAGLNIHCATADERRVAEKVAAHYRHIIAGLNTLLVAAYAEAWHASRAGGGSPVGAEA